MCISGDFLLNTREYRTKNMTMKRQVLLLRKRQLLMWKEKRTEGFTVFLKPCARIPEAESVREGLRRGGKVGLQKKTPGTHYECNCTCSLIQREKQSRHKISAKLAVEWYHTLLPSEPCCGKEKPRQSAGSSRDYTAQDPVKSKGSSSSVWADWPLCSQA